MKMIKILSGEDTYREYPNGDKLYDITAIFVVTKYMGNVKVNDTESKKFEWFDVNNLPENILKIYDLFDKYKISYYCFLKNEDNWGYGNKNQTPEKKQKEFESLSLKSDIVLNLFHNDLECYAIGEYDATDTLYNIFDEIFINETELEEF